jgi:protein-L-isoaspartate O-methyltransferase
MDKNQVLSSIFTKDFYAFVDAAFDIKEISHNEFHDYVNAAYKKNEISKDEKYEICKIYTTKSYLSKDNPRAQSGHSGGEFHYLFSHRQIIDAITKNGTFCDIGCANGHLSEMVYKWAAEIGFDLQVYGVDISEGLIELAQKRLPQWHDNFFIGNAHYWKPKHKFDYIHIMGGAFESDSDDDRIIFEHYIENYLIDGGRFIIGPYWYEDEDITLKRILSWGYIPNGYTEKTRYDKPNWLRKAIWVDKGEVAYVF